MDYSARPQRENNFSSRGGGYNNGGYNRNPYGSNDEQRTGGYGGRGGGRGGFGNRGGNRPYDGNRRTFEPLDLTPSTEQFNKVFYAPTEATKALTDEQVSEWRAEHEMKITHAGKEDIRPVLTFEDANLPVECLQRFKDAGFDTPSPIQCQSWPILMTGHDMIGIAQTGSGKTITFLMPAIVHIKDQPRTNYNGGPICLIMAPTRELVEQIKVECDKFAFGMRSTVAYGGTSRRGQLQALRGGVDILVACPGRLIDFIEGAQVTLRRCTYLVLDEADRMLDMGFEPQIRKICDYLRSDRQTLMFSATWPKEVKSLARDLCREDPVEVRIGNADVLKASKNITQSIRIVSQDQKLEEALKCFKEFAAVEQDQRTIVFAETKRACDQITREFRHNGYKALAIHGDKSQDERRYVIEEFRAGRYPIMVATDVAARGLDIKEVKYVLNYDMPNQIEDYIHRIGRTGRAGATGSAVAFFDMEKNRGLCKDMYNILKDANQEIPEEIAAVASSGRGGSNNFAGRWGGRSGGFRGGRGGNRGGSRGGNRGGNRW